MRVVTMVREYTKQGSFITDKRLRDIIVRSITMGIEYFEISNYLFYISCAKNISLIIGCSDEDMLNRMIGQVFELKNNTIISDTILNNDVIVKYKMNSDNFNQLMNVAEMNAFPKKRIDELLNNDVDFTFCNLEIIYGNVKIKRCA
jgi:hypothetical protein